MNLYELSQSIKGLVKEKKYGDALMLFKDRKALFEKNAISGNVYLIADIITCLRNTGNSAHVQAFLTSFGIEISADTDARIMSSYGWSLYSLLKSQVGDEQDEQTYEIDEDQDLYEDSGLGSESTEIVEQIVYFLEVFKTKMSGFNYTVVSNLFKLLLKVETKKANANWERVNGICDILDVESLSTECYKTKMVIKGKERELEFASDKENWYAVKTKSLLKLGRYKECYELSKRALEIFVKFHYNNDVWFSRRMALSKLQLGSKEEAENDLKALLKRKNEWFIHKELAELAFSFGRLDEALSHCREGLAGHGDLEYKVTFLLLTARVLKDAGQKELSDKHYRLLQLIRENEGWSIPFSIQGELSEVNSSVAAITDIDTLISELGRYWKSTSSRPERSVGKIDKILNKNDRGIDGFILASKGKRVYFRLGPEFPQLSKVKENTNVSFELIEGKDNKDKAIRIRIENG